MQINRTLRIQILVSVNRITCYMQMLPMYLINQLVLLLPTSSHPVATENEIKIRIAQNDQINNDTEFLSKLDNIEVKALNFSNLMGGGILHTKLWISDK